MGGRAAAREAALKARQDVVRLVEGVLLALAALFNFFLKIRLLSFVFCILYFLYFVFCFFFVSFLGFSFSFWVSFGSVWFRSVPPGSI